MTEKKVSVIIPIYNAAQYLHKCLKSVISQTYKNLDIILIDDGSLDDSYDIAKEYQEKDSRIRLFTQTNIGLIATRKRGIELAEGEIVGFVDSDDWIEPIMYERLVQCMEENECDLVSSGIYRDYADGSRKEWYDLYPEGVYVNLESAIYPSMLHDFKKNEMGLKCTLVNKLYRRQILQDIYGEIDTRVFYGEDALTIYPYCLRCKRIYILNEAYYHYYIRNNSMCRAANEKLAINTYYLYNGLRDAFMESNCANSLLKQLKHYLFQLESHTLKVLYNIDTLAYAKWDFSKYKDIFGKRIVIYGAGACGQALYRELDSLGYKENVVAWVDKNPEGKTEQCMYEITAIKEIVDKKFDYLIIAIKSQNIAIEVMKELTKDYAVEEDKVVWRETSYRDFILE
ncbi:glycosyltransferase [Clostridium sp. AF23-8]|jgi:glycosyltransferase involved in cell wall biosynthesis|nr:glycosyltransferase [Clostridium sp. AF23-8]